MGQSGSVSERLNYRLNDARVALQSRNFSSAIPALREGLEMARQENDMQWQARFHFQLGLALQQRALAESSSNDLTEAATHYEQYLEVEPETGSALNNLAQIYSRVGREGDASTLFARAVSIGDDMRGFYAFNYAEFLKDKQVWGEAASYYKIALEAQPDHAEARKGLVEAYQRLDQNRLIQFIWEQIDGGRDVWATTASLQALSNLSSQQAGSRFLQQKIELLACITVGMSRARFGPTSKGKSSGAENEVFEVLSGLVDDPEVGEGIAELLAVYDAPATPQAAAGSWWSDKGDRFEDPSDGWWARDGFRMLLRSIGNWHERRGTPDLAEAYYLHAIHLTDNADREPDLQAIVMLSDLYVSTGKTSSIESLLSEASTDLFFGKGEAYKTSNFKKIYTFHRTLGIMYALIENWGDGNTITSAIFQLEHALDTREIFNKRIARRQRLDEIPVEGRLVNLLARAYTATGNEELATELQLDYLDQAVGERDRFTALEILRDMDYSTLEGRQARRYQKLRQTAAGLESR